MSRHLGSRSDEGTVLFLTLGLSVILLLVVAVVVDVSAVILAKRGVSSAADGAALAAARSHAENATREYDETGHKPERFVPAAEAAS